MKTEDIDDVVLKFKKYRKRVASFTKYSTSAMGMVHKEGYEIDHIFPVLMGFNLGIDPRRISHPNNLHYLPKKDNRLKCAFCIRPIGEFFRMTQDYKTVVGELFKVKVDDVFEYCEGNTLTFDEMDEICVRRGLITVSGSSLRYSIIANRIEGCKVKYKNFNYLPEENRPKNFRYVTNIKEKV